MSGYGEAPNIIINAFLNAKKNLTVKDLVHTTGYSDKQIRRVIADTPSIIWDKKHSRPKQYYINTDLIEVPTKQTTSVFGEVTLEYFPEKLNYRKTRNTYTPQEVRKRLGSIIEVVDNALNGIDESKTLATQIQQGLKKPDSLPVRRDFLVYYNRMRDARRLLENLIKYLAAYQDDPLMQSELDYWRVFHD